MSTDWNVYCLDCKSTNHFCDANHQDEFMALLCKHAAVIAAVAPLMAEAGRTGIEIDFRTHWGSLDPDWFAQHAGHRLVPINEYGDLLTQCTEYVECACGSSRRCTRDAGHDGDHDPSKR